MNKIGQEWASANLIFSEVTLDSYGDKKFDVYELEDYFGSKYLMWVEHINKTKNGLYNLCIENHINIPDGISKDSPCYKQFMKEKEGK